MGVQTCALPISRRNDAVDLATKIVELLDGPPRRAAMGAFGRRRVEEHLEWRHEAPRLLAAYDALSSGSARRTVPGGAGTHLRSRESSTRRSGPSARLRISGRSEEPRVGNARRSRT